MEITIQYTGQLAGITGTTDEVVQIEEGTTFPDLLSSLCQRHGSTYEDLLLKDKKNLRPSTLVIFDGEQADGDPENYSLDSVKTIMFMTPIAGG